MTACWMRSKFFLSPQYSSGYKCPSVRIILQWAPIDFRHDTMRMAWSSQSPPNPFRMVSLGVAKYSSLSESGTYLKCVLMYLNNERNLTSVPYFVWYSSKNSSECWTEKFLTTESVYCTLD